MDENRLDENWAHAFTHIGNELDLVIGGTYDMLGFFGDISSQRGQPTLISIARKKLSTSLDVFFSGESNHTNL